MQTQTQRPYSFLRAYVTVSVLASALASRSVAAPVTTVPWNGHTGAVSFTYDDARPSQIPYLVPQLDSLGLKATFFISARNIGNFTDSIVRWRQISRSGHELTNHTYSHVNVTDANAADTVRVMAAYLRGVDSSIKSLTFAFPNCNIPTSTGLNGVSAENFVARGCTNTSYAWGTQPSDWMRIDGLIMQPTNQSTGTGLLTTAKNQNRWATFIIHDVTPSPDQYSVTPASNLQLLTTAISNGLWIDTYQRIGSYYRAHFTIDTAKAVVNGNGWKLEWKSPHAKMPASVPLRVKLDKTVFGDSAVVVQNGVEIARQSDSTYGVDFMKLRMDVFPKGTVAVTPANRFRNASLGAKVSGRVLRLRGLPAGSYIVALHAVSGALVEQGRLRATGAVEQPVSFRSAPCPGLYQITLTPVFRGAARKLPLFVLP